MKAVLDTNVLVRHLTADPPEQGRRATSFLARADELLLPDLVVAELVYALESGYELERPREWAGESAAGESAETSSPQEPTEKP